MQIFPDVDKPIGFRVENGRIGKNYVLSPLRNLMPAYAIPEPYGDKTIAKKNRLDKYFENIGRQNCMIFCFGKTKETKKGCVSP